MWSSLIVLNSISRSRSEYRIITFSIHFDKIKIFSRDGKHFNGRFCSGFYVLKTVRENVFDSDCQSVRPSVHLFVRSFVSLFAHPFVGLFARPFVGLFVRPSNCLSVCLSIRLSVCLSIRPHSLGPNLSGALNLHLFGSDSQRDYPKCTQSNQGELGALRFRDCVILSEPKHVVF